MKPHATILAITLLSFANHLKADQEEKPSTTFKNKSLEDKRFSRLLHDNAATLQFSSISNVAPPLPGLTDAYKKSKVKNHKKESLILSPTHLGRRTLDYDDSDSFDDNGEPLPRIITEPQPGNEYVYVHADQNNNSVNEPIPLALLKEINEKEVASSASPQGPGVQAPLFYQEMLNAKTDLAKEDFATTLQVEEAKTDATTTEAATTVVEEERETSESRMIVNVVTSPPRMESEGTGRITTKLPTTPFTITTRITPIPTTSATSTTLGTKRTTTTSATTTTTTGTTKKPKVADLKENLVVQSSRRIGTFADFEDSPANLQTSASNTQPARVNVKPSASGKEYEYEYIYYYYDDEDNSTSAKANATLAGKPTTNLSQVENDFEDEVDEVQPSAPAPVSSRAPSTTTTRLTTQIPARTTTTRSTPRTTTTTTTTTAAPVRLNSVEKFSNGGVNEIQQNVRSPKAFSTNEKAVVAEADYKLESGSFEPEYEYEEVEEEEDEESQQKAKGQPQRIPAESDERSEEVPAMVVRGPLTSVANQEANAALPGSGSPLNTPIVLKQSTLLQSVPASRLNPQVDSVRITIPPPTTTTTTTTEQSIIRQSNLNSRLRGTALRGRGETDRQQVSQHEPETRPIPTRGRTPSRRPAVESVQTTPETVQTPSRGSGNVRSRFPVRSTITTPAPTTPTTTTSSRFSEGEQFARNKATNDLSTFTRLQQAISSRAPARKELNPVFQQHQSVVISSSSSEQSTEPAISSEITTLSASVPELHAPEEEQPPSPPTTTTTRTTTTTEKPAILGRQRNRFATGRIRTTAAPEGSQTSEAVSQAPNRGRFNRRRTTTAPAGDAESSASSPAPAVESEKPRVPVPSRNRFSTRTRPTTAAPAQSTDENNAEAGQAGVSPVPNRRRPSFQNRRRLQPATTQEAGSDAAPSPSTQVTENSATSEAPRRRPLLPNGQRRRPGPGVGGPRRGRLGASTTDATSTTEKIAENVEQSFSVSEQVSEVQQPESVSTTAVSPSTSPVPAPVDLPNNGRPAPGGLGRLRNKTRPIANLPSTSAPETPQGEKKTIKLNGILGRRRPGSQIATTEVPKVAETSEDNNNNAKEVDYSQSQHKGVVVQVSSSVTESEEVHPGEDVEPASSTPGSILTRLKSQRKPGSIFRKRTDPHGE